MDGFTPESWEAVQQLLYKEIDWEKEFRTGKGPGPQKPGNYDTGAQRAKGPGDWKVGEANNNGDMGKRKLQGTEMLSGVALPKGPANPAPVTSKEVFGMRAFAEENPLEGECNQRKKREQGAEPRTREQMEADRQRSQQMTGGAGRGNRSEAAKKAAETRARCGNKNGQRPAA